MTTRTSTPTGSRSYSARELQAAAAALASGRFSTAPARPLPPAEKRGGSPDGHGAVEANQAARNLPASSAGEHVVAGAAVGSTASGRMVACLEPLVRVRAANAGAGASTIALALADAADAAGVRTRVLDAAAPAWSGLVGATAIELGSADGWRRGRRGRSVLIDRVAGGVQAPADVPAPRPADGIDLTLLDAGWSMRELAAATEAATEGGTWLAAAPARVEVIVTRPHGLALSQTEAALADLEERLSAGEVVVVVVGAGRWSRESASAGRRLRDAHEQEAVLFAPLLPARTLPGLGPDPLPRRLTDPARRLLGRIATITGPLTAAEAQTSRQRRRRHR